MKPKLIFSLLACLLGIMLCFSSIDIQIIKICSYLLNRDFNEQFSIYGLQHVGLQLIVMGNLFIVFNFHPNSRLLFRLSISSLITIFFIGVFKHSVNIPMTDDYWTIIKFSNQYFPASASDKLKMLFSFYSESRMVIIRILLIVIHFITGTINIKYLILFANLSLMGILFICHQFIADNKVKAAVTFINTLLLFQFSYYDAIVWATNAVNYQLTILFVLLTLYLLNTKYQLLAVCTALMAALTFGNGLLIFPIVLLFYILKKDWKHTIIWSITILILTILYFQDFNERSSDVSIQPMHHYFIYSCCFLGSAFQFMYNLHLPFLAGLTVWVLFIFVTIKKYYTKNYVVYGLLLFTILSSLIAAYFRTSMGISEAISNRYGIFSILTVCTCMMMCTEITLHDFKRAFLNYAITLAITYQLLSSIFFFPEVIVRKEKLLSFITAIENKMEFHSSGYVIPPGADSVVKIAMEKKIYHPY